MPVSLGLSAVDMRARIAARTRARRKKHPDVVRASDRKSYQKNRDKKLAGHKRWRAQNKIRAYEISRKSLARLEAIKVANPCPDCRRRYPPECMDFDHRPGVTKVEGVGHMVACRWSWAAIEAEVAKCDIVCANCHRIRTKSRLLAIRIARANASV